MSYYVILSAFYRHITQAAQRTYHRNRRFDSATCGTLQLRLRRLAAALSQRRRSFERHNVIFLSEKGTATGVPSVHLKSRYEKCAQLSAELHNARTCQRVAQRRAATRRGAPEHRIQF